VIRTSLTDPSAVPPSVSLMMRHAFDRWPERTFLVSDSVEYTYADADRETDRVASLLAAGGVRVDTHVAASMVWTLLAIARLGAIGVPLNVEAKGGLLRYYLADSQSTHMVVDNEIVRTVADAWLDLEPMAVWTTGVAPVRRPEFAASIASLTDEASARVGLVERTLTDPFLFMYTSGTTGPSKAVVVPNGHATGTAVLIADRFELTPDDRHYTCLPLFHANAYWYTLLPAMSIGSAVILGRRFSASNFWSDIDAQGATITNVMGTMLQILIRADPNPVERENDLNRIFVVPFPVDPVSVEERFGAKLMTTYALTEWIPVALSSPGEGYDRREMAGPVLPYSDVRIVNDVDEDVETNMIGEIILRARRPWARMIEYFDKQEESEKAFRNGWFHTGDLGRVDVDGYLYFVGRKKDAIRRRGENISAYELEMLLAAHPKIAELAAIPFASELGEEDVAVVVLAQPGCDLGPEEVLEFAQRTLPRYMVPTYIRIVDALPKTATSKIEKYRLIAEADRSPELFWRRPGR